MNILNNINYDISHDINCNIREKLWTKRNSINENIDYISKLLKFNEIDNWRKVINTNKNYDLFFKFKDKQYKVKVEEDKLSLKLLEKNDIINYHKRIYCVAKGIGNNGYFHGDDCWMNLLSWIIRRSI